MIFTIDEIFEQASSDRSSAKSKVEKGEFIIKLGVKIQRFPSKTEILNCSKGGDYYREMNNMEYSYFFNNGWKKGVLLIALNNCNFKLNLIEIRMKEEMNTRKNDKHIQNLKTRRDNVMNKYAKHKLKLNQLN